ncbi:MAG: hypothetical protein RR444_08635, partial [Oscillospiraceae bacterium]
MKKIVAVTLCIAMLAASLAGCASTNDDKTSSQTPSNNVGTEDEKKEITLPYTGEEIVYKAYGYEGLTIDPTS